MIFSITDSIIIRPLTEADAESLATNANNKNVSDHLRDYFPYPYTVADAEKFISICRSQPRLLNFTIAIENNACGMIGCGMFGDVNRIVGEMGYWLGEPFWGRNIITQCIAVFTTYLFDNFDVERIQAPVFEYNKASMRVLEKNDFALESIMKRSAIKNNRIIDQYLYVKFRDK